MVYVVSTFLTRERDTQSLIRTFNNIRLHSVPVGFARIFLIRIPGHLLRDKCIVAAAMRNEIYVKDNCHIATRQSKFAGRHERGKSTLPRAQMFSSHWQARYTIPISTWSKLKRPPNSYHPISRALIENVPGFVQNLSFYNILALTTKN